MIALCLLLAGVPEAIGYLEAEVPAWKPDNGCYSCHNNGDGARALIAAGRQTSPPVADTLRFLRDVSSWPADMPALALVQYGSALAALGEDLSAVSPRLTALQKPDGHWEMDAEASIGSPVTYGPVLGTVMARKLVRDEAARAKAEAWLKARRAEHPLDLAALVLAFARPADAARLAALQNKDGSWNAGEAFDTAIAMLALKQINPEAAARGRAWLLQNQLEPGGWRGTTRPAGGPSYAQHISTTAWAVIALVETNPAAR